MGSYKQADEYDYQTRHYQVQVREREILTLVNEVTSPGFLASIKAGFKDDNAQLSD